MLNGMDRNDLPVVVVLMCFGNKLQYLGRVASVEEFKRYKEVSPYRQEDLAFMDWSRTCRHETEADLAVFRKSRSNSLVGKQMREHLGMQ